MSRTIPVLLVTLLALAAAPAAHAEVVRGPEPVGDTVAWSPASEDDLWCADRVAVEPPEGAAGTDLVGLTVRHKRHRVALTVRYAEGAVRKVVDLHLDTPRGRWMLSFARTAHDRAVDLVPEPTWELEDWDEDGDGTADCQVWSGEISYIPCQDRLHASVSADRRSVRLLVPRRCLQNPRWVRAGGSVFMQIGDTTIVDTWDPDAPSTPDDPFDPNHWTYGARVVAGPQAPVVPVVTVGTPSARATQQTLVRSRAGFVPR